MSPKATIQHTNDSAATYKYPSRTCNIMSYQYGHLAAHAIESVLNQTVPFDVVRFFDDGVGDCAHLLDIYPEVEFILRPVNLGIIDNFNDALNRTETEQVLFLGADNYLDPSTLELIQDRTEDIVSYDGWKFGNGPDEYWQLYDQPHGSALYNVAKAKEAGGYRASGNEHTEEDSMLFSAMRANGATFAQVPYPLLFYRWRHRRNFNQ